MLKCYPIEATLENWLHDSVVAIISEIHNSLDTKKPIKKTPQGWDELVPATLEKSRREGLVNARKIRDLLFAYLESVRHLTSSDRKKIFLTLESQNRIPELLAGVETLNSIENDFPDVQKAVKKLFIFCYGKLTDFKVRDRQYGHIFNNLEEKICPFCGIERMMHFSQETAQDQDHYLAKSIYPFAAANMRNLVPMCRCCNRDYKKAVDVLRDSKGARRLAFDPYKCNPPNISLLNSLINKKNPLPLPTWKVDFTPLTPEAKTWDSVFKISKRYKRDILNHNFKPWLEAFRKKCVRYRNQNIFISGFTHGQIGALLKDHYENRADSPSIGMAGFLEPLVFEFLLKQFDNKNPRVVGIIYDAVMGLE